MPASVLLVDDRPENLLALAATLEKLGHRLVQASSGDEALKHVLREPFAVILLDLQMPGLDGLQTASLIKSRAASRHTPIIFLTASDDDVPTVLRAYELGAVDFLRKPFDPGILRSKVAVFVELYLRGEQIKRHEAENEARQRIHSFFMQAPAPICVTRGPNHEVELANAHYVRIVGDRDEREIRDRVYKSGQPFQGDEVPLGDRFFNVLYEPFRDADGRVEGVMTLAMDVTDQVLARKAMEQAIHVRDDFLSIASHELNTPLTPLKMQIASLRRHETTREKLLQKLDVADRQITRMTKLVSQLLDVSRITAGKLALDPERLDVAELVRELAARFSAEAERAQSPLEVRADVPAVGVFDRLRLEQVFMNLLTNAVKYGSGKPVVVTVARDGAKARLTVKDGGIGIEPTMQARIFERFERAVSSRHYGGFGLGLWIARQILDASGGTIRVESKPGEGSTFVVELPLVN